MFDIDNIITKSFQFLADTYKLEIMLDISIRKCYNNEALEKSKYRGVEQFGSSSGS